MNLFQSNSNTKAHKLYCALPYTNIITFLLDSAICASLEFWNSKVTHMENTYKSATKNNHDTRPISYKAFKALKVNFDYAPKSLPQDKGRLICKEK